MTPLSRGLQVSSVRKTGERPLLRPLDLDLFEEGYVGRARSDPSGGSRQQSFDGIIAPTSPTSRVRTILGNPTPQVGNCKCNDYRTVG
jgi:hypothetical protein